MSYESFFNDFQTEHRTIRDLLMNLITAFLQEDLEKAGQVLGELNKISGSHFRYEEEAVYPSLKGIYGDQYIEKLMTDHDLILGRTNWLVELLKKNKLSKEEKAKSIDYVRATLPHVSDCQGVTIMVEKLGNDVMDLIVERRDNAIKENYDLTTWSTTIRTRPFFNLN